MRQHQNEQVTILLQELEEKEKEIALDNKKKERVMEKSLHKLKMENKEREQKLKIENERVLALLMEENEKKETLMLARHADEEKEVVKRAKQAVKEISAKKEAQAEGNVPVTQPQVPECPVSSKYILKTQISSKKLLGMFGRDDPTNSHLSVQKWAPSM